jgi:hypothetical protein
MKSTENKTRSGKKKEALRKSVDKAEGKQTLSKERLAQIRAEFKDRWTF